MIERTRGREGSDRGALGKEADFTLQQHSPPTTHHPTSSKRLTLNGPRLVFVNGDLGEPNAAGATGSLHLTGEALAFHGPRGCGAYLGSALAGEAAQAPSLTLTPLARAQATIVITAATSTCYAAVFPLLGKAPPGRYQATFTNDLGDQATLAVPLTIRTPSATRWPWMPTLALVAHDADSLSAALATAAANVSGAVITLAPTSPEQPITLSAPLLLPNNTVLRCDGAMGRLAASDAACPVLYWKPTGSLSPVIGLRPPASPSLPTRVRLENLRIVIAGPHAGVVSFTQPTQDAAAVGLQISLDPASDTDSMAMGALFTVTATATGLLLANSSGVHGGNCSATHWPHNTAIYVSRAAGSRVHNNTFTCGCQGYSFDSPANLIVTNNFWRSVGAIVSEGSGISTFTTGVAENVYFAFNTIIGNPDSAKRFESFTYDGPNGVYFGNVTDVSQDGRVLTTGNVTHTGGNKPHFADGGAVTVMAGPGLGATARLAICPPPLTNDHTLCLRDALPLTLAPRASLLTATAFRGQMVFEGNSFVNGTTFQLYGAGLNVTIAGNRFHSFGNVGSWGLFYQGAYQPCAFNSFLGNVLENGGNLHALGQAPPPDAPPYSGALAFAQIFRANRLCGRSSKVHHSGSIDGLLMENTLLYDAGSVTLDSTVFNAWLYNTSNATSPDICQLWSADHRRA